MDLGAVTSVNQVVLKLPPTTARSTRTQTLSVPEGPSATPTTTVAAASASAGPVHSR